MVSEPINKRIPNRGKLADKLGLNGRNQVRFDTVENEKAATEMVNV